MTVVQKLPNDPEESAIRWLALPREERRRYLDTNGNFLPCLLAADTLLGLLRKAIWAGEIVLVEGAEPMDAVQLPDQRQLLGDGPWVRALRVEFVADQKVLRRVTASTAAKSLALAAVPPKRRGPKPKMMKAVRDEMLRRLQEKEVTPEKLADDNPQALAAEFKVSRGTVNKAREEALSLFDINCQNKNSDK
jgi:hypothetical protein